MDYRIYQSYRKMALECRSRLQQIRDMARGKSVYIIGTGPSILRTDLTKIDGGIVIFLNNAQALARSFNPEASLSIISDHLRAIELRQTFSSINMTCIATTDKVVNPLVAPNIFSAPYTFVMPKLNAKPDGGVQVSPLFGFSPSPEEGIYLGKSVVFPAIQIAYYMGASRISLVGVDMTLGRGGGGYYTSSIQSNWSQFSYPNDGRPHFAIMADCLRERGVLLENLTVGGALDVLPHDPLRLARPDAIAEIKEYV